MYKAWISVYVWVSSPKLGLLKAGCNRRTTRLSVDPNLKRMLRTSSDRLIRNLPHHHDWLFLLAGSGRSVYTPAHWRGSTALLRSGRRSKWLQWQRQQSTLHLFKERQKRVVAVKHNFFFLYTIVVQFLQSSPASKHLISFTCACLMDECAGKLEE